MTYQKTHIGTLNSNIKSIFINVENCLIGKRFFFFFLNSNLTDFLIAAALSFLLICHMTILKKETLYRGFQTFKFKEL